MEVISKVIPYRYPDKFRVVPLGDIHLGPVHCDEDLFESECQEIKRTPNTFWLGMGDYADLISPDDFKRWDGRILAPWMKGHEDNIGPTQLDAVCEHLDPIWNKCLGLIEGNHDDLIRRHHHYDFMAELLKRANKKADVPYAGASCFVVLKFQRENSKERHDIRIHARHGDGSARTSGARALSVLRLAMSMVNAHIVLMGHLHGQDAPDIPQRLIEQNGEIKSFPAIATMTGAWLRAYAQDVPPCYLERWGCPPSTLGCPHITIEPTKHKITLEKSCVVREL